MKENQFGDVIITAAMWLLFGGILCGIVYTLLN
jgi:hypothetical protein